MPERHEAIQSTLVKSIHHVMLKRLFRSAIIIVCVQHLSHLEFCATFHVRKILKPVQDDSLECFYRMPRSLRSAPPKSAVLDYWQLEVLPLALFCIRKNSLVSNFYAGRAGCLSGTRRTCQKPLTHTSCNTSFQPHRGPQPDC